MKKTLRQLVLSAMFGAALLSTQSHATIVSVMCEGNILIPNNSSNTGATANFFDDVGAAQLVHAWTEQENTLLDRNIVVDIVTPAVYGSSFTSANFTIPQGTWVNSHLLHFDPLNSIGRVAQFTFGERILGIIVSSDLPNDDRLLKTDFLGHPLTIYPSTHFGGRGIDFALESLTLSPNMQTVRLDLTSATPGTQVRVITQGVITRETPEPSTGVLGSVCAVFAVSRLCRQNV